MTFRMTPQRMAILDCLKGSREHPSAEEIFRQVREGFPSMSLATVYNTLGTLRRKGMIVEMTVDPRRRRYDYDTSGHHHLLCRNCGKVVDITHNFQLTLPETEKRGFRLESSTIEFYGTCPDCRGEEVKIMAEFQCDTCGTTKEGRCKPKKCPQCGAEGTMKKQG